MKKRYNNKEQKSTLNNEKCLVKYLLNKGVGVERKIKKENLWKVKSKLFELKINKRKLYRRFVVDVIDVTKKN